MLTWDQIAEHVSLIKGIAHRYTRDTDDAAQEVMIRAFEKRDTFKGGNIETWLAVMTRNFCFNLKRRKPFEPLDMYEEEPKSHIEYRPTHDFDTLVEKLFDGVLLTTYTRRVVRYLTMYKRLPENASPEYKNWWRHLRPVLREKFSATDFWESYRVWC